MCLYLAAKFTGECSVEFIAYKCALIDNDIGHADTAILEKFIVHSLEWKCSLVTSAELLDALSAAFFPEVNHGLKQKAIMIIDFCLTGTLLL